MTNVIINASNLPLTSPDFEYKNLGMPTEEQLGIGSYEVTNNQTPQINDPANWFIFDPGNGQASTPTWVSKATGFLGSGFGGSDIQTDQNRFVFVNPGGYINEQVSHRADRAQFFNDGGPRNKGYTSTSDTTWIRTNTYVRDFTTFPGQETVIQNQAWREGCVELTIKPTLDNRTIVSGSILSSPSGLNPPGATAAEIQLENATPGNKQNVEIIQPNKSGPGPEKLINEGTSYFFTSQGNALVALPDSSLGATFVDNQAFVRGWSFNIVNGVLNFKYEIFYGINKKRVEFSGTTNILDGEWHHVVLNRPSPFTFKSGGERYEGEGCIEIWIDGKLEVRNFEITTSDILPTPTILFNDSLNVGILNYKEYQKTITNPKYVPPAWITEEISKTNYVGGIRDYIFRQSLALTPNYIELNYAYAMLNSDGSNIEKAPPLTANAVMLNATVTVNTKKVLKLFWNNLLENKENMKNGLELDETYQVYSYSMTHKNLVNPTKTFNLDLNDTQTERFFVKNVKTAIENDVYILRPGLIQTSTSSYAINPGTTGFVGRNLMADYLDDTRGLTEAQPDPWFINNLQYGGVELRPGDRILLTGQNKLQQNGIWQFNGGNSALTRVEDIDTNILENAHVFVEKGNNAGKTYVQTEKITHLRKSKQLWREIDTESNISTIDSYPIFTTPWVDERGNTRFIDVNSDIAQDYDIIAFMNYPIESKFINNSLFGEPNNYNKERYEEFINNLKIAINSGKSIYVSSPMLAVDLGVVSKFELISQLHDETGDAQSAAISPFESNEPAENYFNTHRNMKYLMCSPTPGLTDIPTYIMSDFVTYSPNKVDSEYHIKYTYRQFGIEEGDEFYIPGLTTLPETLNENLPGFIYNQRGLKDLAVFKVSDVLMGNCVTRLANIIYDKDDAIQNPYDDYITTIVATMGSGKIFVNCIEDGYAFSRSDYNTAKIQNVQIGENAETVATAAWQYSTSRVNRKNLYDFSDITNPIGQTVPTEGGGGAAIQAQSHASNGMIRKNTNKNDLAYQSDLYIDFNEEVFETTEIPVLSMTWLGLKWLAE
jgi:hypothetical protein